MTTIGPMGTIAFPPREKKKGEKEWGGKLRRGHAPSSTERPKSGFFERQDDNVKITWSWSLGGGAKTHPGLIYKSQRTTKPNGGKKGKQNEYQETSK